MAVHCVGSRFLINNFSAVSFILFLFEEGEVILVLVWILLRVKVRIVNNHWFLFGPLLALGIELVVVNYEDIGNVIYVFNDFRLRSSVFHSEGGTHQFCAVTVVLNEGLLRSLVLSNKLFVKSLLLKPFL